MTGKTMSSALRRRIRIGPAAAVALLLLLSAPRALTLRPPCLPFAGAAVSASSSSPPVDADYQSPWLSPLRSTNSSMKRRVFFKSVQSSVFFSTAITTIGRGSALADATFSEKINTYPKITQKISMDIRISRSDGTFYVKDEITDDEPFYGQTTIGLFGDAVPNHAKEFLKYVVPYEMNTQLPSYSRAKFQTLDSATGLLVGGTIPGLAVNTIAGGQVLEYSGRVLPANLWLEDKNIVETTQKISHNAKGLLTHRNLDLTPAFGITTRSSTELDSDHTVFGVVLEDGGFLEKVVDLPVLTDEGRVSRTTDELTTAGQDASGSLASSLFAAQRRVFRDAAKTFGDSRLDKVGQGKLLRRIEVTKIGLL